MLLGVLEISFAAPPTRTTHEWRSRLVDAVADRALGGITGKIGPRHCQGFGALCPRRQSTAIRRRPAAGFDPGERIGAREACQLRAAAGVHPAQGSATGSGGPTPLVHRRAARRGTWRRLDAATGRLHVAESSFYADPVGRQ